MEEIQHAIDSQCAIQEQGEKAGLSVCAVSDTERQ